METINQPTFDILALPVELQRHAITFLDPITLVSLSQTDTYFRRLIQPGRHEIVERLLQLECTVEHGGGLADFRSRDNHLSKAWDSQDSSAMRWACVGCLRLLSHEHFDNHNLLRLAYRKPVPGSTAATHPVTSWGNPRKLWGKRFFQPRGKEETHLRQQYRLTNRDIRNTTSDLKELRDAGLEGIDDSTYAITPESDSPDLESVQVALDKHARAIELERSGYKRHLRKCNECRFQNRELGKANSRERGTPIAPIQPSRRIACASRRDRYFPGLAEYAGLDRLSALVTGSNAAKLQGWPTRMIRCPSCSDWQEMRSFRLGTNNSRWLPIYGVEERDFFAYNWDDTKLTESVMNELRCNSCFATEHGPEALAKVLSAWAKKLMRSEISSAEFALFSGWEAVRSNMKHIPSNHQSKFQQVLDRHEASIPGPINHRTLPSYKAAHDELRSVWDQMKEKESDAVSNLDGEAFKRWLYHYDEFEAKWELVTKLNAIVVKEPEVLAAWALN